jgi:prepilin-type N-terminal cleavage/methylation domain-containing protein
MLKKLNKQKGFTIVEVMIVLAIAGVIMLVVFLAVPALQRNSRNTTRRADVSHLGAVLSEWVGNHQGTILSKVNDSTVAAGPDLTSETFSQMGKPANNTAVTTSANPWAAPAGAALDTFYVYSNATCNGSSPAYSTSAKSYAIAYYVEPGTTLQCAAF